MDHLFNVSVKDVAGYIFVFDKQSIINNHAACSVGMSDAFVLCRRLDTKMLEIKPMTAIQPNKNLLLPSKVLWKFLVKVNTSLSQCLNKLSYNSPLCTVSNFHCSLFEYKFLWQKIKSIADNHFKRDCVQSYHLKRMHGIHDSVKTGLKKTIFWFDSSSSLSKLEAVLGNFIRYGYATKPAKILQKKKPRSNEFVAAQQLIDEGDNFCAIILPEQSPSKDDTHHTIRCLDRGLDFIFEQIDDRIADGKLSVVTRFQRVPVSVALKYQYKSTLYNDSNDEHEIPHNNSNSIIPHIHSPSPNNVINNRYEIIESSLVKEGDTFQFRNGIGVNVLHVDIEHQMSTVQVTSNPISRSPKKNQLLGVPLHELQEEYCNYLGC
jgi:hypothetical protein